MIVIEIYFDYEIENILVFKMLLIFILILKDLLRLKINL